MPYKDPEIAKQKKRENYLKNYEERRRKQKEYYENNKEKINSKGREWVLKNKERVAERQKAWRENNKDYIEEYRKGYYAENKEKIKENSKKSIEENKDKFLARLKKYRATDKGRATRAADKATTRWYFKSCTPKWVDRKALREIYKKCRALNDVFGPNTYHVDHIIPIRGKEVCGLHVPWNLRIVPRDVNLKKTNKLQKEEEYINPLDVL